PLPPTAALAFSASRLRAVPPWVIGARPARNGVVVVVGTAVRVGLGVTVQVVVGDGVDVRVSVRVGVAVAGLVGVRVGVAVALLVPAASPAATFSVTLTTTGVLALSVPDSGGSTTTVSPGADATSTAG